MASIKIDMTTQRARKKLEKLRRIIRAKAVTDVMERAIIDWMRRNFIAEGLDKKWKPLAQSTRAVTGRRKAFRGGKMAQAFRRGRLRNFVDLRRKGYQIRIGLTDKIARWHHSGTRPYIIRPKRASLLRFQVARGPGGVVFANIVRHPGLPSRRLLPTSRSAKREIAAAVNDMLVKETRGL